MVEEKELERVKQLLDSAESNIRAAKSLLFSATLSDRAKTLSASEKDVVEGIFNGEAMTDAQGKVYPVPANYASKSKLVPGDALKLTILEDGSFLFKQIGPVKRKKMIGELAELSEGEFCVRAGETDFRVLPASVTYFKANAGDKLTILIPEDTVSEWAAVENKID